MELREPALEPLIRALMDEDWDIRKRASETLGKIGDKRAVAPLTEALTALSDEQVRRLQISEFFRKEGGLSEFFGNEGGLFDDARTTALATELMKEEYRNVLEAMREALDRIKKN